nr:hypothetical protein [uncultured Methanospirillum sp.]
MPITWRNAISGWLALEITLGVDVKIQILRSLHETTVLGHNICPGYGCVSELNNLITKCLDICVDIFRNGIILLSQGFNDCGNILLLL